MPHTAIISEISAQQLVVIRMRANPKPLDALIYRNAQSSVRNTNAHASESGAFDVFEMQ